VTDPEVITVLKIRAMTMYRDKKVKAPAT
jgi:hypothetical protein